MAQTPSVQKAYLLLTLTTLFWGCNAVFGRMAVGELSPMLLVSLRWLGSSLLLLIFAFHNTRKDWPVLRQHLIFLGAMGSLGFTVFNALFYLAAHETTAVNIGIIQGSMPVIVLIGAFIVYRARITAMQLAGVMITIIGVSLVASAGSLERLLVLTFNHGDLLMIIACLFYAGYAVGLRKAPKVAPLSLFTVLAIAALIASLPLTAFEYSQGNLQWPTAKGWVIVVLVTLLPSFLSQIFFIQGVAAIGPERAGVFINLVPVFAAILAVTFLQENFEFYHGVALVLVLGGIGISEFSKIRR